MHDWILYLGGLFFQYCITDIFYGVSLLLNKTTTYCLLAQEAKPEELASEMSTQDLKRTATLYDYIPMFKRKQRYKLLIWNQNLVQLWT